MDSDTAFQVNYSALDRLIHRIAFSSPLVQLTAADIERTLFGSDYASVNPARPIFVTSLPRAGTTVILEALYCFPFLATHLYRDMPFVLSPVIWSRLTGRFQKGAELRERAHGDGVQVGYDSPEAFEEIYWRAFWPEKYASARIELWTAEDGKDDAKAFFVEHMKKIIALRRPGRERDGRYFSKNNGNMARLNLIGRMFPDAKILIPIRRPIDHAASLLRQHRNFIGMQKTDRFIGRYMADIGHYEFGSLHRPIAFPGLDALISGRDPLTVDYWIAYWIAAFEHVLSRRDAVILVSYEDLCDNPRRVLSDICDRLNIADRDALGRAAALFKTPPRTQSAHEAILDSRLRDRAEELCKTLLAV